MQLVKNLETAGLFRKGITQNLRRLLCRRETAQVMSLYISMFAGVLLGFGVSIVNTRLLGPQLYGDFKFLINLFTFVATITTFGFFYTGGKLLAGQKDEQIRKELVGGLFLISSIISLLVIFILFVFSFFIDDLFHHQGLGKIIRLFSPLLLVFPFRLCLENIMQGDNRIFQLAIFQRAKQVLYLIGALTVSYIISFSLTICLTLELGFATLVILIMLFVLRPKLVRVRKILSQIYRENRIYGFHVYVGSLANVATAMLMGLFLGYIVDTTEVGFYSLALTITTPLSFIPSAVGTTLFKTFASRASIPKKAILVTIGLTACTLIAFYLLVDKVVLLAYSAAFSKVIHLAYIAAIGKVFWGTGDFVNRFLGAHGKGEELRNSAFIVGASIITGSLIFIPAFGAFGAIITDSIAGGLYCAMMCYYYRKVRS